LNPRQENVCFSKPSNRVIFQGCIQIHGHQIIITWTSWKAEFPVDRDASSGQTIHDAEIEESFPELKQQPPQQQQQQHSLPPFVGESKKIYIYIVQSNASIPMVIAISIFREEIISEQNY